MIYIILKLHNETPSFHTSNRKINIFYFVFPASFITIEDLVKFVIRQILNLGIVSINAAKVDSIATKLEKSE